jgi:hypothetical protein
MPLGGPRSWGWCRAGGLAAALAGCAVAVAAAADPLAEPVRAVWSGLPIRDWADRVGRRAGLPVVVDWRLDPDVTITGTATDEPLSLWLDRVATAAGGAVEPLESAVAIVPASRAGIARRAQAARRREVAGLPAARRAVLAARRPWAWPAGARPRDLVAVALTDAGRPPRDLDRVPHDHLPAASLPDLSVAEFIDLVLAPYDLRVAWATGPDGAVVPIEAGLAAEIPAAVPPRGSRRRGPAGAAEPRFTLALEAPLDDAARAVAAQLGLTAHVDRESLAARGIQPGEIVRARVTDATRDELLDAIVAPLGLRWTIEGDRLVIDAATRR